MKSFDWRKLQRYLGPQAGKDLNNFLEKLPQTAGQAILIAVGIVWTSGAAAGLFATVQTQKLIEVRTELANAEALKPVVPRIKDLPVPQATVKAFAETLTVNYPKLSIKQQGPAIFITAQSTGSFGEFREAIGHVQNGGSGWRVSMEKLCVGRECPREKLAALLKINKVSVDK